MDAMSSKSDFRQDPKEEVVAGSHIGQIRREVSAGDRGGSGAGTGHRVIPSVVFGESLPKTESLPISYNSSQSKHGPPTVGFPEIPDALCRILNDRIQAHIMSCPDLSETIEFPALSATIAYSQRMRKFWQSRWYVRLAKSLLRPIDRELLEELLEPPSGKSYLYSAQNHHAFHSQARMA
jgi:hypothetical protein